MSELNWEMVDVGFWKAAPVLTDDGRPFYWRIRVTEDGLFSLWDTDSELLPVNPRPFQSLSDAKKHCQTAEDLLIAAIEDESKPEEKPVLITGPCMGRTRGGEGMPSVVVEIEANDPMNEYYQDGFVWKNVSSAYTYRSNGSYGYRESDHLDIVKTWPIGEDEPVEPDTEESKQGSVSESTESSTPLPVGVSLRDWFAGQALTGLLSIEANPRVGVEVAPFSIGKHAVDMAQHAYTLADAMMRESEKGKSDEVQ